MQNGNNVRVNTRKHSPTYLLILLLTLTLAACGGGSSGDNSSSGDGNSESQGDNTDSNGDSQSDSNAETDTDSATGTGTGTTTAGNNSGSNTTPSGGDVSFIGSINFDQNGQSVSAGFLRTSQTIPVGQIQSGFLPSTDSCEVTETSIVPTAGTNVPGLGGIPFDSVSAGDVITLTSPAGTFAELGRREENGFIFYEIAGGDNLPGAVPAGTVIDIPGDEFPAFSNVAIPNVTALTNVASSTGAILTPDSTVSWNASSDSNSIMNLSASSTSLPDFTDPNFDPANFDPTSLTITFVSCTVTDDGSFSFPPDIRSQMGNEFMADSFNLSRDGYSFEQNGNALFTIGVSSEN